MRVYTYLYTRENLSEKGNREMTKLSKETISSKNREKELLIIRITINRYYDFQPNNWRIYK